MSGRYPGFVRARYLLLIGGLIGLLVDVDHVLFLVATGQPITWDNLAHHSSRFLHAPMVVCGLSVFLSFGALFAGFLAVADYRRMKQWRWK